MKTSNQTGLSCRHIDLAGASLCVGASVLAYLAVLQPLVQQRDSLAGRRDELADRRRRASHLAVSAAATQKRLLSVRRELADSRITLEPASHINRRIAELTELLNECGLKVDTVRLGKTLHGSKYDVVPIGLAGLGGYKRCAAFLHRLSTGFPDTSVASFEISGNPQEPEDKPGEFRFGLSWHAARRNKRPQR